jgi:hypothetical protein
MVIKIYYYLKLLYIIILNYYLPSKNLKLL